MAGDRDSIRALGTRNQGKGAAVRTGLGVITAPIVIVQDADLEYDPVDYPRLIGPMLEGRADLVYGVRGFADRRPTPTGPPRATSW